MPCDNGNLQGGCMANQDRYPHTEPARSLEDALCSACTELEEQGIEIPPAAASIWEEHKKKDGQRKKAESASKRRAKLIKSALAKLTKEEKDALGIR